VRSQRISERFAQRHVVTNTRAGVDMLKEAENVLIDFRVVGLRKAIPHQSASGTTRDVTYRVRHTVRYDSHHTLTGRNPIRLRPIEADERVHSPYRM